jgi:hypothetical protein
MKSGSFALPILAALALCSAPASADIIFMLGNNPQSDEQNILFDTAESGLSITGATQSGVGVVFTSTQTLYQRAQGQADIFGSADTPNTTLLTNISITTPGYTFQDFILNLQNGTGTATVTAIDNFNTSFQYELGNGQNFLTILAVPGSGQSIESISVQVSGGGFSEFKQPRISGPAAVTQLPEPGSLALLGAVIGAIGVTTRRKRS